MTTKSAPAPVDETVWLSLTVAENHEKGVPAQPVIKNLKAQFRWTYDFKSNTGLAHLEKLNNTEINPAIQLNCMGIEGQHDFMSDMEPTEYNVGDQKVVLNRVIFDEWATSSGNREYAACILFNKSGDPMQQTENWEQLVVNRLQLLKADPKTEHLHFTLKLDKLYNSTRADKLLVEPCDAKFSTHYNVARKWGTAELVSINKTKLNITLHPMGIQGADDFMSNIEKGKEPTIQDPRTKKEVPIFRVILDTKNLTDDRVGSIMFGDKVPYTIQTNKIES